MNSTVFGPIAEDRTRGPSPRASECGQTPETSHVRRYVSETEAARPRNVAVTRPPVRWRLPGRPVEWATGGRSDEAARGGRSRAGPRTRTALLHRPRATASPVPDPEPGGGALHRRSAPARLGCPPDDVRRASARVRGAAPARSTGGEELRAAPARPGRRSGRSVALAAHGRDAVQPVLDGRTGRAGPSRKKSRAPCAGRPARATT